MFYFIKLNLVMLVIHSVLGSRSFFFASFHQHHAFLNVVENSVLLGTGKQKKKLKKIEIMIHSACIEKNKSCQWRINLDNTFNFISSCCDLTLCAEVQKGETFTGLPVHSFISLLWRTEVNEISLSTAFTV